MRTRALALAFLPALLAPAAASARPEVASSLGAVLARASSVELATPDPYALAGANSLETAIRAALPDAPATPPVAPRVAAGDGALFLDVALLSALPADLRGPVSRLLAGVEAAEALRASAVPTDPVFIRRAAEAAKYDGDLTPYASRIDEDTLLRSTLLLAATVDRALVELRATAPSTRSSAGASCDGTPRPPTVDVEGQVAIDVMGSNTEYTKPYSLVIDFGGCDTYTSAVGGANGLAQDPVAILLDLGPDDDTYSNPPDTFALGGALAGTAVSVDEGGFDVYRPSGLAALGAGVVGGVGIHADLGGPDDYRFTGTGGGYGAEGLGTLGVGVMLDLGGADDTYDFDFFSPAAPLTRILSAQGVGIGGIGVLADDGGDETYETSSSGNSLIVEAQGVGDLQQSRGVLLDASGDDTYLATVDCAGGPEAGGGGGVEAQGLGVQDSSGFLVDGSGDDRYTLLALASGGPGAGAHAIGQGRGFGAASKPGIGLLADLGGDDMYGAIARATADDPANTEATVRAQGEGFFFEGLGILFDADGDDDYRLSAQGGVVDELGQGAATSAATGLLIDQDGNDTYVAGPRTQGYAETEFQNDIGEVHGAIGALIDGGGRNSFTGPGRENFYWARGETSFGLGMDGGEAHSVALTLYDAVAPVSRPHPIPQVRITSPEDGFVLHGDLVISGSSDGSHLEVDRVEQYIDNERWVLAEPGPGGWDTWTSTISAAELPDGQATLRARAWASRIDSDFDWLRFDVERWIPEWLPPIRSGDEVTIGFDLRTRTGQPVDESGVALLIDGAEVPLEADGGRYTARVPLDAGGHDAAVTIPGQLLGSTTLTI